MGRRGSLLCLLLLIAVVLPPASTAAQSPCPRAYCLRLPELHTPEPVVLVEGGTSYFFVGSGVGWNIYGSFANATTAPICHVLIDYYVDYPTANDEAGSVTLPVVMPDENEWRWLVGFPPESGYSLITTIRSWQTQGCAYVRLTTPKPTTTLRTYPVVEGIVRNDSSSSVRNPRIRITPGHDLRHHYDFTLDGVTLAPGATATYSQTMTGTWSYSDFSASAIAQGE